MIGRVVEARQVYTNIFARYIGESFGFLGTVHCIIPHVVRTKKMHIFYNKVLI
jgi:hypothetical protein